MRPHPGRSRVGFVRALSLCLVLALFAPLLVSPVSAQEASSTDQTTTGDSTATNPVAQPAPVPDAPPGPAPGTELPERRTAASKTFVGADNRSYTTEVSTRRIHYRNAQGGWSDRDTRLVADDRSAPGNRWRNAADDFTLSFATSATDPQLVRFELTPGQSIAWSLQGARPGVGAPLDSTMTWHAALPSVDVQVTTAPEGVKETLVLASAQAQDTFVYPLQLQGLTPELTAEGTVVFKDAAGAVQATIPKGLMWDSAPGDPAYSDAITYSLTSVDGQPSLQVNVDRAWLSAPQRIYPVFVDPLVTRTTESAAPNNGQDTWIKQSQPSTNFGSDTALWSGWAIDNSGALRTLLKFNVSSIGSDKTVNWADLQLFNTMTWDCTNRETGVYALTSSWDASTVTWNTTRTYEQDTTVTPSVDKKWAAASFANGEKASQTGTFCNGTGQWTPIFRLADPVRRWIAGTTTNNGFELRGAANTVDYRRRYNSAETGSNTPTLKVNWSEPFLGRLGYYPLITEPLTDRQGLSVNAFNGNLLLEATDLTLKGPSDFDFKLGRVYNSRDDRAGGPCQDCDNGLTGLSWKFDMGTNVRLSKNGGDTEKSRLFEGPSGYRVWFKYNPAVGTTPDSYTPPPGVRATLTRTSGTGSQAVDAQTVTFIDTGIKYNFDNSSGTDPAALISIEDPHNNRLRFVYTNQKLTSIVQEQNNGSGSYTTWNTITITHNSSFSNLVTAISDGTRTVNYTWSNPPVTNTFAVRTLDKVEISDSTGTLAKTEYFYDGTSKALTQIKAYKLKDASGLADTTTQITNIAYNATPTYWEDRDMKVSQITWADDNSGVAMGHARSFTTYTYGTNGSNEPTTTVKRRRSPKDPLISCITDSTNCEAKLDYVFFPEGKAKSITDSNGLHQDFTYDTSGNDAANVKTHRNKQGGTSNFAFNSDSMMTSAKLPGVGQNDPATDTFTYNGPNKFAPDTYTNSQGAALGYSWDSQGHPTQINDSGNTVKPAVINYDSNCGLVTDFQDGELAAGGSTGPKWVYGKDTSSSPAKCRVGSVTPPTVAPTDPHPLGTTTLTYDSLGRVATMVDGKIPAQTTTYTYDNLDRTTKITYQGGSAVCYAYDGFGNMLSRTDIASGSCPTSPGTSSFQYTYDARNRRASETQPGSATQQLVYKWDGAGNLIEFTDDWSRSFTPTAKPTVYTYDLANQLIKIKLPDDKVITYSYCDPRPSPDGFGTLCTTQTPPPTNGKYTKITFPNNAFTEIRLNDSGQISQVRNNNGTTDLSDLEYTYTNPEASNKPTRFRYKIHNNVGNTDLIYKYSTLDQNNNPVVDPLGRIRSSSGPNENFTYTYDKSSNLLTFNNGTTTTNFFYDNTNELCWKTTGTTTTACDSNPSGGTSFGYDRNGNLTGTTSDTSLIMEYNAKNQTTRIKDGTSDRTMTYAGNSQMERTGAGPATFVNSLLGVNKRISSTDEVTDTPNTIDTSGTTYYIRDANGAILGQYRQDDLSFLWFGIDALGSIRHATDALGVQKNSYSFGPFGETVASSESKYMPWRFTGAYDDDPTAGSGPPSALYKMGMRYYQPGLARWTQRDPLNQIANAMTPADANPYVYAACNGVNFTDPTGLAHDTPICSLGGRASTFLLGSAVTLGFAAAATAFSGPLAASLGVLALVAGTAHFITQGILLLACSKEFHHITTTFEGE